MLYDTDFANSVHLTARERCDLEYAYFKAEFSGDDIEMDRISNELAIADLVFNKNHGE